MNLYALIPGYAPNCEVQFILAESDGEAMDHGVYVAAHDAANGYTSPTADVYLIAENVRHVGAARGLDAPWPWAHPAVEEAAAFDAKMMSEHLDHGCSADSIADHA